MISIRDFDFLKQFYAIVGRNEEKPLDLSIIVTPYMGSSGPAGVVLTIFGTPPRATLFVPLDGAFRIYTGWGNPRVIEAGAKEFDSVISFLRGHPELS